MKRKMIYTLIILVIGTLGYIGWLFWVAAGKQPSGQRLERCEQSPQWKNGEFVNTHETPAITGDESMVQALWKFLFKKVDNLKPSADIPVVKTDLKALRRDEEICLWLGHSTLFIQTGGVRFLFDPVLTNKLPVWFFMRPFEGADAYVPDDIPDVDYLVITHDHWDHLDWQTVRSLRPRVKQVICSLGIGAHLEYWGYDPNIIHDMDWQDSLTISPSITVRCLPARHFSGRLFSRNKTLWASYLIDGPRRIFVSADGGYDDRFQQIGQDYPNIDLAIMENGQYDAGWKYIHLMPSELPKAIEELGAHRVLTYHNSKYALANHSWTEPLDSILAHSHGKTWQLLTPHIGEPIKLTEQQTFDKWW